MKVGIELQVESLEDIDKNIRAQERAIKGRSLANDFILLNDTQSILLGIKAKFVLQNKSLDKPK